jgi:hypothetical protein
MKLHNTQSQVAKDKSRFRVLCCGRQWGKTTLAVEEIKGKALYVNESRIVYLANTYQQARDIAWQMLLKELQPIIKKINESRLELTVYNTKGGTSLIQLRGWEAVETLRGQQFDLMVLDEVASMRNFWLNWQEVLLPTLTFRKGNTLFISTPKGFNHFYDLYNTPGKDFKSFHFTSYDNPFLAKEEIDKAKEKSTEDRFAQEYLADFRKTEGLVYKEFSRERHVTTDTPQQVVKTICGIDFGYTNPAAVVPIRIDADNHYWIGEEWYKTRQTTEQIAEIALRYKPQICYPDPAEPDRVQILRKAGLNCREVSKDIPAGIDHIRELFKQNRIHIHPNCKNLIWELETYRYPDKTEWNSKLDKHEKELPIKENDHALDALRYTLFTHRPKIEVKDNYFEHLGTYYQDE